MSSESLAAENARLAKSVEDSRTNRLGLTASRQRRLVLNTAAQLRAECDEGKVRRVYVQGRDQK